MNRIRQLRKERKWTVEELSKRTGISRSMISCYETGKRSPSTQRQEILSDIFNVDIDYLMGRSEVRRSIDLQSVVDGEISSMDVEVIKKLRNAPEYVRRAIFVLLDAGSKDEMLESYFIDSNNRENYK